jgi:hypothetical protein
VKAEQSLPDLHFTAAYAVKPDSFVAAAVANLAREIAADGAAKRVARTR